MIIEYLKQRLLITRDHLDEMVADTVWHREVDRLLFYNEIKEIMLRYKDPVTLKEIYTSAYYLPGTEFLINGREVK